MATETQRPIFVKVRVDADSAAGLLGYEYYYYNKKTKETTWHPPPDAEIREKQKKYKKATIEADYTLVPHTSHVQTWIQE